MDFTIIITYYYWFTNWGKVIILIMQDINNREKWVWGTWELFVLHISTFL